MRATLRIAVILLVAAAVMCWVVLPALSQQIAQGKVVSIKQSVLTIKPASGPEVSFSPRWVKEGAGWQPSRPVRNYLAALEPGEEVRITWTMDEKENRRRMESLEIAGPREGTTKGIVVSATDSQVILRPREQDRAILLNTTWIKQGDKWIPDPAIAPRLAKLAKETKITLTWRWDDEGRKRITSVVEGW